MKSHTGSAAAAHCCQPHAAAGHWSLGSLGSVQVTSAHSPPLLYVHELFFCVFSSSSIQINGIKTTFRSFYRDETRLKWSFNEVRDSCLFILNSNSSTWGGRMRGVLLVALCFSRCPLPVSPLNAALFLILIYDAHLDDEMPTFYFPPLNRKATCERWWRVLGNVELILLMVVQLSSDLV